MPLTFSHPAIVLPLSYLPKRWVSLTGLIAGSVAPDFEYIMRMKVSSIYSHTWLGLLWFDLPIALLICFVYHDLVRNQFIANLPAFFNLRFTPYTSFGWNIYFAQNIAAVILSILVGGASHLFWDSFTHISGYFVVLWNMAVPVNVLGHSIPIYKIIQHSSTLLGAIVILIAICKMPRSAIAKKSKIWPYWFIVTGVLLLVISFRLMFGLSFHQYWNILVTAITGGIMGVILASLIKPLTANKQYFDKR